MKDKTPIELWTGKAFDINLMKTFGSEVYVHVPKQKRRKWDAKSEKSIFVGYGEDMKGYRIDLPELNAIEIAGDVVFTENPRCYTLKKKVMIMIIFGTWLLIS